MSIFDRFKKTKKDKKATQKETKKKAPKEAKEESAKETLDEILNKPLKETKQAKKVEKKQFSDAYRILESAHVTEKSGAAAEEGIYIFLVSQRANKHEIKKAVQDLYGVGVERVNIINIPRKARRLGRSEGFKPGFRKAMVKLAQGEKIEIMPR